MSLQNRQNLLAKLYTDAEFRRAFLSEPEKIGAENDLSQAEIEEIATVMPEELEFFAESLFWKRLREAEKFLPVTRRALEADFTRLFREFSQGYNPQTIKKHLEDALEFCRFLQFENISEEAKNAARFERAKHSFFAFEKRISVCRLDFDLVRFQQTGVWEAKKKTAIWLKIGKRFRHFFI
jgi:hypothetical protein